MRQMPKQGIRVRAHHHDGKRLAGLVHSHREAFCVLSWPMHQGNDEPFAQKILSKFSNEQLQNNSSRGSTPGLIDPTKDDVPENRIPTPGSRRGYIHPYSLPWVPLKEQSFPEPGLLRKQLQSNKKGLARNLRQTAVESRPAQPSSSPPPYQERKEDGVRSAIAFARAAPKAISIDSESSPEDGTDEPGSLISIGSSQAGKSRKQRYLNRTFLRFPDEKPTIPDSVPRGADTLNPVKSQPAPTEDTTSDDVKKIEKRKRGTNDTAPMDNLRRTIGDSQIQRSNTRSMPSFDDRGSEEDRMQRPERSSTLKAMNARREQKRALQRDSESETYHTASAGNPVPTDSGIVESTRMTKRPRGSVEPRDPDRTKLQPSANLHEGIMDTLKKIDSLRKQAQSTTIGPGSIKLTNNTTGKNTQQHETAGSTTDGSTNSQNDLPNFGGLTSRTTPASSTTAATQTDGSFMDFLLDEVIDLKAKISVFQQQERPAEEPLGRQVDRIARMVIELRGGSTRLLEELAELRVVVDRYDPR